MLDKRGDIEMFDADLQGAWGKSTESWIDRGTDGRESCTRKISGLHAYEFYVWGECICLCPVWAQGL